MSATVQAPPNEDQTPSPKPTPGGVTPPPSLSNVVPPLGGGSPLSNEVPPLGGGTPLACTRYNTKTWQEYQDWKAENQQAYEQIYQRPLKCIYGCPREMSHTKMPPHAKILVIEMNNDENQIKGIGVIQNQTAREVYRTPPQSAQNSLAQGTAVGGRNPQIKGIGVIQNQTAREVYRTPPPVTSVPVHPPSVPALPPRIVFNRLFGDRNYTRYIYIGNEYYATKEELERNHTPDAQYINEQLEMIIPPALHPQQTMNEYLERLLFKGAKHMKRGSGITKINAKLFAQKQKIST